MAPERRVQVLIKDRSGRAQLVADAHPKGWNRGIVNPGASEPASMRDNALMEVIYTLPNDVLQQGIVQLPASIYPTFIPGSQYLPFGIGATRHTGLP